jgi:hypothetical protein
MDEEDENEDGEEEGSPEDGMGTPGQDNGVGPNNMDDYEEIDYKICGELGKALIFSFNF